MNTEIGQQTKTFLGEGGELRGVCRIDDTVRRPRTRSSGFIAALLKHLQEGGFYDAPRYLGVDEQGRDIFSFIEGEVPTELAWHTDETLCKAAGIVRAYHDATICWPRRIDQTRTSEVICHNDLSPCNFVFRDGLPIAIIDFDAVEPGSREQDVGYALWMWLDLGNMDISIGEQLRRLRLFLTAYGMSFHEIEIGKAIVRRQEMLIENSRLANADATVIWASECLIWTKEALLPLMMRS